MKAHNVFLEKTVTFGCLTSSLVTCLLVFIVLSFANVFVVWAIFKWVTNSIRDGCSGLGGVANTWTYFAFALFFHDASELFNL